MLAACSFQALRQSSRCFRRFGRTGAPPVSDGALGFLNALDLEFPKLRNGGMKCGRDGENHTYNTIRFGSAQTSILSLDVLSVVYALRL